MAGMRCGGTLLTSLLRGEGRGVAACLLLLIVLIYLFLTLKFFSHSFHLNGKVMFNMF